MIKLGINVDHIATVRQARRETLPSPVDAARAAIKGGARGITAHLREDRRHIQDADLWALRRLKAPLNMEMAAEEVIVRIALALKPAWTCLVPEKRAELTTEGGLNLVAHPVHYQITIKRLQEAGIRVSLFVEPDPDVVRLAARLGADAVELHTGRYARLFDQKKKRALQEELARIKKSAAVGQEAGLLVNAGHGINYDNVAALAKVFPFNEFNIGFAVIARALFVGMTSAVREMKRRMDI